LSREPLDERVQALVLDVIESVEQLEILMLLATDEGRTWTAEQVAKELRSSPRSATRWLELLQRRGYFAVGGEGEAAAYSYAPESSEKRRDVSSLIQTYIIRRVTVIDLIYNRPKARLQTLADAFKLREKK